MHPADPDRVGRRTASGVQRPIRRHSPSRIFPIISDGAGQDVDRRGVMKLEIERKFLLANDGWKAQVVGTRLLRDGLVASDRSKVRVRIEHPKAWLTIKGERSGLGRAEFNYEIPLADAEVILAEHCGEHIIQKMRHLVLHEGVTWEVDVYQGVLEGVCYAEVELDSQEQAIALPPWVGAEVTGDPSYSKRELVRRYLQVRRGGGHPGSDS